MRALTWRKSRFLKKDWGEARKRFEQLLSSGESIWQRSFAADPIQNFLTYLMEGKGNMVDSILAKLELSPDTPAVDYVKQPSHFNRRSKGSERLD